MAKQPDRQRDHLLRTTGRSAHCRMPRHKIWRSCLAALSDPVRLRIFSIIASQDETCSCNLEIPLGKSQPTVSHHTRKLAAAGLIVGEKRGRWTWWRAVPEQVAALAAVLGATAQARG